LPARQVNSGFVASLMGAITMLVATPCVAPPMLAALAWASQANNAWPATLGLASLGLGLGAPATIAAVCGVRLARNGGSSNILQLIIGGSLTLLVLILLSRVVGYYFFIGLIIIWLGLIGLVVRKYLCEFGPKKTLPLFVLVLVSGFVISYFMPANNAEHLLGYTKFSQNDSLVVKQKQFVGSVIYFHADWCSSCRNLERGLLANADIINDLEQWQKFAIDLTSSSKTELLLQKKWRVVGPPTLLLFNADGKLLQSLAGEISFNKLHKALSLSKLTVKP
jgi:thiol:disulfide interchange protein DsbD